MKRTLVGYVPINQDGTVFRSTVSNAYKGGRGSTRKNTMKMYPTEARAAVYSPVKKSKPVYFIEGDGL